MNPLNTVTGTIVAGFVLALVLGMIVNKWEKRPPCSNTVNKAACMKKK